MWPLLIDLMSVAVVDRLDEDLLDELDVGVPFLTGSPVDLWRGRFG